MTKRAKAPAARARRTGGRRAHPRPRATKLDKGAQSLADLQKRLGQRDRKLKAALAQQAATSEVLRVISSSPGELEPVFDAVLTSAVRICSAKFGVLFRYVDEAHEAVAMVGVPRPFVQELQGKILHPGPDTGIGRVALTKKPFQVSDLRKTKAYVDRDPLRVATVELGGARSFLAVPLLKEHELTGEIFIYRRQTGPFTSKQIELVQNFAAQAVIAIENVRLFDEIQEKSRELEKQRDLLVRQSQIDSRYLTWLRRLASFLRHEVRQPVAQVNSSIELVQLISQDKNLLPHLGTAAHGTKHVWNLIERASKATDSEAFVRDGQPRVVELRDILDELVAGFRNTHSGIAFSFASEFHPAYVFVDPMLIKEAVSNLLTNAASFAMEDSTIELRLTKNDKHAVIDVTNEGPTIEGDKDSLFNPFVTRRADPSGEHHGIGLYLVRLIAENYGGVAEIANLSDGSGVKASMSLMLQDR